MTQSSFIEKDFEGIETEVALALILLEKHFPSTLQVSTKFDTVNQDFVANVLVSNWETSRSCVVLVLCTRSFGLNYGN